ncbi:MAG: 4-phosphoerythronate dehydrogenase [Ignavibacteria bacterium]
MLIVADSKIPFATEAFAPFGEVRVVPTTAMTRETIREADVLLIRSETNVSESLLDGTHVRFVGTATIGFDHVDVEYLRRKQIAFASCPGSNANSVAEYVLAALLEWGERLSVRLREKTLGIVGHGNTGSRTAAKAEALGMNVLLNDPPLARATGDPRYLPLDALMQADIISLHVPLTYEGVDATFHLFDEHRIAAMKAGAILINTSRGAVVDSAALKRALDAKHLSACVLDVWENEPAIDAALLARTTFGTPHIAGYSYDGKLNATRMLVAALSKTFGIAADPPSFLDEQTKTPLVSAAQSRDDEDVLRAAVRSAYDIRRDDERLRKILTLAAHQRAEYFRRLRAEYPLRREFHHYALAEAELGASTAMIARKVGFSMR